MSSEQIQVAIGLVILAFVVAVSIRHGRLNPNSTGSLGREIGKLNTRMTAMEKSLGGCATTAALGVLASEVRQLEATAASSGEVVALEGKINALGEKIEGGRELQERTWNAVDRIQNYFIEEAFKKMGGGA